MRCHLTLAIDGPPTRGFDGSLNFNGFYETTYATGNKREA